MKNLIYLNCLLFLFAGCKDEPEQIPSYLRIEPFTVDAQGNASWHKLTEGWLYVNGEYLGAYTLPAEVPILADGDAKIWVYPGVKENGINVTPNIYPILTRWEGTNVALTPGEIKSVQPNTKYDLAANFPFGISRGDFDGGSSIVLENRDNDPATSFSLTTDGAFNGKCILMEVDTAHTFMEVATEKVSGLPNTGAPEVWLEMHYKCDIPFLLYLIYSYGGDESTQAVYQFNVSEEWNKIYLNLTQSITATQALNYRLFYRAVLPKDNNGNYPQLKGAVRIDNIRITHL
ncbi:MAG: hypothetical protein JNJ57_04710 [Saprospiraceae bacterium]|nr:hypothetical protein [Saprospiraceae bacterium]